jgi:glycosyltransferase involved in cell wall biosynthesis
MNNILSINIPTYNRVDFLEKNLKNLIPMCKKHSVPIYVSDNNSDDQTVSMLKKYTELYEFLFISVLDSNFGIDFNMNNVVCMSTAKYSWLFSDDDEIFEGSVDVVLDCLTNISPDFLLLNCREAYLSSGQIISDNIYNIESFFQVINNGELLRKYAHILTLLSACVVKTKLWKEISLDGYKSKYYFHLHNIYSGLDKDSKILLLKQPLFCRMRGNDWNFDKNEIDYILHYFYPKTIEHVIGGYEFSDKLNAIKLKLRRMKLGTFWRLRESGLVGLGGMPISYFFLMQLHLPLALISLFIPGELCGRLYRKLFKFYR